MPCAILAAVVYGASTAVQHQSAQAAPHGSLLALLRDPRWLLAFGGDGVGLILQVVALATGPVLLIQPLLVLALPVALPVGWILGGPRPSGRDVAAVLAVVSALGVFFVLVGDPSSGHPLSRRAGMAAVTAAVLVAAATAASARIVPRWSSVLLGGVGGAGFALVGVLINAADDVYSRHGLRGLGRGPGVVALFGVLVVGALAITFTQLAFRSGALGASFAANEAGAPVVAVVLGSVMLGQRLPVGPGHLVGYLVCVAAIVVAVFQLASPTPAARAPL